MSSRVTAAKAFRPEETVLELKDFGVENGKRNVHLSKSCFHTNSCVDFKLEVKYKN